MSAAAILFWLICALTVVSALGCALARNLFRAALSLGACLIGVAALYLFLEAEYLAAIQLVVYVGGILVLTIFGVMFSSDILGLRQRPGTGAKIAGLLVGAGVLAVMGRLAWLTATTAGLPTVRPPVPAGTGTGLAAAPANNLGDLILGPYAVPALIAAVLLLVVAVAAMAVVRKDESKPEASP